MTFRSKKVPASFQKISEITSLTSVSTAVKAQYCIVLHTSTGGIIAS